MSGSPSQAFRVSSSSKITTIPTRHDPKTGKRVVRWIDIQQYYEKAKGILNGVDAVLFLTNDNLEDLIPRRIAHHPGVILEVLMEDGSQGSSSTISTLGSTSMDLIPISGVSYINTSSSDTGSMARDLVTSTIEEIDDDDDDDNNQVSVVHSSGLPSEYQMSLHASSSQGLGLLDSNPQRLRLEMSDNMVQQEQMRQLKQHTQRMQQQMDEILQQAQDTQQQLQQKMDEDSSKLQLSEQITQTIQDTQQQQLQQHMDEIHQKLQQTLQQTGQQIQHTQQQLQQQMDEASSKLQLSEQTVQTIQDTQQQLQQHMDEVHQKLQDSEQQTLEQTGQQIQHTQQQLQQQLDEIHQKMQHSEQQTIQQMNQQIKEALQKTQQ
ncbi:hypothetical protein BGZ65_008347, partial [Modicella reniformis]